MFVSMIVGHKERSSMRRDDAESRGLNSSLTP